jgi:hypothetical protein
MLVNSEYLLKRILSPARELNKRHRAYKPQSINFHFIFFQGTNRFHRLALKNSIHEQQYLQNAYDDAMFLRIFLSNLIKGLLMKQHYLIQIKKKYQSEFLPIFVINLINSYT